MKKIKAKQAQKVTEVTGPCFSCENPARTQYDCLTCEKLGKEFLVKCCRTHAEGGVHAIRKHALVKHPANLLRVCAAALRGE